MGVQTLKHSLFLATVVVAGAVIALPYVSGGGTPASSVATTSTASAAATIVSGSPVNASKDAADDVAAITDATISEIPATVQSVVQSDDTVGEVDVVGPQNRVKAGADGQGMVTREKSGSSSCASAATGTPNSAPGITSKGGVPGTTSDDLATFARAYDQIRIEHCLQPIPLGNIKYNSCLEQRLFWMAEDPSPNPASAWGHTGTAKRSDGVPIVGCDGDIAGGMNDTGDVVAQAWWTSIDHRDTLYEPAFTGNLSHVCIGFAMTHGGISVPGPNEPYAFTRAAAIWVSC